MEHFRKWLNYINYYNSVDAEDYAIKNSDDVKLFLKELAIVREDQIREINKF